MPNREVTRAIKKEVERELWARAAGRCEFDGCNRIVFKSPITQETANISEKAHIWSFSKNGPRGWGPFITNKKALNDITNLMLLCHDCHELIDQEKDGGRYPADLLCRWKNEHEKRVAIVTGVDPSKKSHVLLYGAKIGEEDSMVQPEAAKDALFPDWYPAEERCVSISMSWEGKDSNSDYWTVESKNLQVSFERYVRPVIQDNSFSHLSVFALAPMPLMILLGSLLTDKVNAQTYQLHREPKQTWHWLNNPASFAFQIKRPVDTSFPPALVISLSAGIAHGRITSVMGETVSIWELTIDSPYNDFLKSKKQLSMFREAMARLIVEIAATHGKSTPLAIFPAMPVACAVELGRVRMPKADMPWVIYDENKLQDKFVHALTIS